MRVLIACEFSGVVCRAFRDRGFDAWSCDILPTEWKGHAVWHRQCDVLTILDEGWGMMLAFPPCTHLAVSGARYFAAKKADGRQQAGIDFFMALTRAPIPRIAIENPVGIMSSIFRKPDQIIQPWQFGCPESKATCLWLKGLSRLVPTNVLPVPTGGRWQNQTKSGQNKLGPSPTRAQERGRTYWQVAAAMAEQWP